jgi:hypothetical protein
MYKAFDKWLLPYLFRHRHREVAGETHVMIAVCDHFEPLHHTDKTGALKRIGEWCVRFPDLIRSFQDADGQNPRHTFFFPVEQYDRELLEPLAGLCQQTGSEVEIHLHHDNDTEVGLVEAIERGKKDLGEHGLLSRDEDGKVVYGFIHGNWALDNSHPDGRYCGIDRELGVLKRTGCYADFTMPSAPHPTQARIINSIYYSQDSAQPKSHDHGTRMKVGVTQDIRNSEEHLLLIQGPLGLNWKTRKWGVMPRVENGDLTQANPPTALRLAFWKDLGIHVEGRPEWIFIKLHTHGGIPPNYDMLLGGRMMEFHQAIQQMAQSGDKVKFHYVTAREMANIAHAAEQGKEGNPGEYRDFCYRKLG